MTQCSSHVPDMLQQRTPRYQKVQKSVEISHVQFLDSAVQLWKDSEDPAVFVQHSIPRYSKMDDEWFTQYATCQDKWPSDSLPVTRCDFCCPTGPFSWHFFISLTQFPICFLSSQWNLIWREFQLRHPLFLELRVIEHAEQWMESVSVSWDGADSSWFPAVFNRTWKNNKGMMCHTFVWSSQFLFDFCDRHVPQLNHSINSFFQSAITRIFVDGITNFRRWTKHELKKRRAQKSGYFKYVFLSSRCFRCATWCHLLPNKTVFLISFGKNFNSDIQTPLVFRLISSQHFSTSFIWSRCFLVLKWSSYRTQLVVFFEDFVVDFTSTKWFFW